MQGRFMRSSNTRDDPERCMREVLEQVECLNYVVVRRRMPL